MARKSERNYASKDGISEKRPLSINFLLGCSQDDLSTFLLARLADVANLRDKLQEIFDQMAENLAQAAIAQWFRDTDRQTLKQALDSEESAFEWARRMVRGGGDIIPRISFDPGQSHRTAVQTYRARNGKASPAAGVGVLVSFGLHHYATVDGA